MKDHPQVDPASIQDEVEKHYHIEPGGQIVFESGISTGDGGIISGGTPPAAGTGTGDGGPSYNPRKRAGGGMTGSSGPQPSVGNILSRQTGTRVEFKYLNKADSVFSHGMYGRDFDYQIHPGESSEIHELYASIIYLDLPSTSVNGQIIE